MSKKKSQRQIKIIITLNEDVSKEFACPNIIIEDFITKHLPKCMLIKEVEDIEVEGK